MKSLIFIPLFLMTMTSFGQQRQPGMRFRFSNEDIGEMLMQRGKQQQRTGWIALASGSVITGICMILAKPGKDGEMTSGESIKLAGLITTFTGIPLIVMGSYNKRKAEFYLNRDKAGYSFVNRPGITSLGIKLYL